MPDSVQDIPICSGCRLMSHIPEPAEICNECWHRRESWAGGGPLRVVTENETYHETPLCPAVRQASAWAYWRDEDCMHADLGGRMDKCIRCHSWRTFGFDEYVGDEDRQVVIGHA